MHHDALDAVAMRTHGRGRHPPGHERRLPLSLGQESVLLLADPASSDGTDHMRYCLRLRGGLDIKALRDALQWVGARHEALRAAVIDDGGGPLQVLTDHLDVELPMTDLTGLAPREAVGRALASAVDEVRRPFDLDVMPLWRARLWRIAPQDHILLWFGHQVVCDAPSLRVVLDEVAGAYTVLTAGGRLPPELPVGYVQYVLRERQQMGAPALRRAAAFWRDRLAGAPEFEVPAHRPRPPQTLSEGTATRRAVTPSVWANALHLCRAEGVDPLAALATAYCVVLHRYTGSEDMVVRVPGTALRSPPTPRPVGCFLTSLPLRCDLTGGPTWREVLRRTGVALGEVSGHALLPFMKIVEATRPVADPSRPPLFQVALAVEEAASLHLPGLQVDIIPLDTGTAPLDLSVTALLHAGASELCAEYHTHLFDAGTVERLLAHLERALAVGTAEPDRPVADLSLLGPGERVEIRHHWSGWRRPLASRVITDLFHEQVVCHPDAIALVVAGEGISYAELNRRSNRLAHLLRAAGAGPDRPVALCLARGVDLPVAVLAILKAGAAYVALDPALPPPRLRFILEDAAPVVVLAHPALADRLSGFGPPVLRVESLGDRLELQPDHDPPVTATPGSLAYVLYTSGSTGRPKGVAMPHRALVNLVEWQRVAPRGTRPGQGRTLQFTTIAFDVAFQELFVTWCSGDTLVIPEERVRTDPELLLRVLRESRITTLYLPFVALDQLAHAALLLGEVVPDLRDVYHSGEQLKITPALRSFFAQLPGCLLHNQYGPTETHVCTEHTLQGPPESWPDLPPIGRPIDNARCYVLDSRRGPVPAGGVGSLHVGGMPVAHGYVARPDLTGERFLELELGGRSERVYDTGDLVRLDGEGRLQYLGRGDSQIKIHGYRVELGEIETELCAHPAVTAAVVAVRTVGATPSLVAYWIPSEGARNDRDDRVVPALRNLLARQLPSYMLPRHYLRLERFPLTASGKVDRKALPDPTPVHPDTTSEPPATPWEELVADVLAQRLGVSDVGRQHRFLEIGGHSLAALAVVAEIETRCGVRIPFATFLDNSSVAEIATELEQAVAGTVHPAMLEALLDKVEEIRP